MINEYLYKNKTNMYAVAVPSITIKVKKNVALENVKLCNYYKFTFI